MEEELRQLLLRFAVCLDLFEATKTATRRVIDNVGRATT
jgi:hypothetical protein